MRTWSDAVEQKLAELREADRERAARRAELLADRRERLRASNEARAEERLRRQAEILVTAAAEPDRQILEFCWLCGSNEIPDGGLVRFALPLPVGTIDGQLCKPCRARRGWAELTTHRLWAERPELCEGWGWRPYPAKAVASVRTREVWGGKAYDNPTVSTVDETDLLWTVPDDWHRYTWAWRVLEWRRAHATEDKPKNEPRPSRRDRPARPFGWLK